MRTGLSQRSGAGAVGPDRGWNGPTRFNPSLAKPLRLPGGKPALFRGRGQRRPQHRWGGVKPRVKAREPWRGNYTDFNSPQPPCSSGARRGEGNEPGPLAQEPGSQRLLPCAMTSPQRRGGGAMIGGVLRAGMGLSPRAPPARPGDASPLFVLPRCLFPCRAIFCPRFPQEAFSPRADGTDGGP